jgi:hypothetical protein
MASAGRRLPRQSDHLLGELLLQSRDHHGAASGRHEGARTLVRMQMGMSRQRNWMGITMINRKRRPTTYLNRWRSHSEHRRSASGNIADFYRYWRNVTNDAGIMVFDTKPGSKVRLAWVLVHDACLANLTGWASR